MFLSAGVGECSSAGVGARTEKLPSNGMKMHCAVVKEANTKPSMIFVDPIDCKYFHTVGMSKLY